MAVKSEAAPRASIADTLAVYLQRRVLIVMFLVHVLFFHGHKAHSLEGSASVENPNEQVVQGRR